MEVVVIGVKSGRGLGSSLWRPWDVHPGIWGRCLIFSVEILTRDVCGDEGAWRPRPQATPFLLNGFKITDMLRTRYSSRPTEATMVDTAAVEEARRPARPARASRRTAIARTSRHSCAGSSR